MHGSLEEKQLSGSYYQAVAKERQIIQTMHWIKSQTRDYLKYEKIKTMLIQANLNQGTTESRKLAAKAEVEMVCYRCYQMKHMARNCTAKGFWYYNCNPLTDHRVEQCRKWTKGSESTRYVQKHSSTFKAKDTDKVRKKKHIKTKGRKGSKTKLRIKTRYAEKKAQVNVAEVGDCKESETTESSEESEQAGMTGIIAKQTFIADSGVTDHLMNTGFGFIFLIFLIS